MAVVTAAVDEVVTIIISIIKTMKIPFIGVCSVHLVFLHFISFLLLFFHFISPTLSSLLVLVLGAD